MRILYIEHYAGSPQLGMEYRPYYLAKEWVKAGHDVTIVAASYAHPRSHQPSQSKKPRFEDIEGIRYLWIPTPVYSGNGLGRVQNILAFLGGLRSVPRLLSTQGFDVVIASSTYPFDNGAAHSLAKRWNAAHIYEIHDLWPLSPMELGGYSKYHPFIMITQIYEDFAYKHADAVVSLLPNAEEYMRSRGLAEGKFNCVPNGIVVEDWLSQSESLARAAAKQLNDWAKERFLVCYAGAHGVANALDAFIDAGMALDCEHIGLVLVGQGPERARLIQKAAGSKNIFFMETVPKYAIPSVLSRMDVLYLGLQSQKLYRFGISPNKLMDYLMAAKPIICAVDTGNDIVGAADCGMTIKPESPAAIIDAITRMAGMGSAELREMGRRGREYVLANHDYKVLAARFLEIMEGALAAHRRVEEKKGSL